MNFLLLLTALVQASLAMSLPFNLFYDCWSSDTIDHVNAINEILISNLDPSRNAEVAKYFAGYEDALLETVPSSTHILNHLADNALYSLQAICRPSENLGDVPRIALMREFTILVEMLKDQRLSGACHGVKKRSMTCVTVPDQQ